MFSSSYSSSSVSLALRSARSRSRSTVPVSPDDNSNTTAWQIDPKHVEPLTLGLSLPNSAHQNQHHHYGHHHYHQQRAHHAHVPPFTLAEFEEFVCAAFDPSASSARPDTRLSSGSDRDGSKSPNPNPHPRRNLPSAQPSSAAPSSNANANFGAGDNLNPDCDYQCRGVAASEIAIEHVRFGLAESNISNPADAHGAYAKYVDMDEHGVTRKPSSGSKRRSSSSVSGRGREKRKHTRANPPHALAGMGTGSIGDVVEEDDYQDDSGGHCQLAQESVVGSALGQWEEAKRNFGYTNRINMPSDTSYNRHHHTVSSHRRRSSSSLLRASKAKSLPSRTKVSSSSKNTNHRPFRIDLAPSFAFGLGLENIPEFKETEVSEVDFVELKELEETCRKKYEIKNFEKKEDTRTSTRTSEYHLQVERFEPETEAEAAQCSFVFGIGNSRLNSGSKSGDPLKPKPTSKLKRNRKPTPKLKQLGPNDMILITPPSSVPSAHSQSQHSGQGLTAASTSTIDVGLSGCMSVSLSASGASSAGTSVYLSTTSPFPSRSTTTASTTTTTTNTRTRTKAKTNGYASGWADSNSKATAASSSSAAGVGSTLRRRLSAIHMPTSNNASASGSGSNTTSAKRNNEHLSVQPTVGHTSLSIRTTSSAPNLFARIKKQLSRNSMVEVQLQVEGGGFPIARKVNEGGVRVAIERENEKERKAAESEELKITMPTNKKPRSRKLSKKNKKKLAKEKETDPVPVVITTSIQPPSSSTTHQEEEELKFMATMSTSSLPLVNTPDICSGVERDDLEEHASASDSDSSTKTTKTIGSGSGKKKKKRSARNRRNRSKQRRGSGSVGGSELEVVNVNGGTSSPSMYSCDSAPLGVDTEAEVEGGATAEYTPYVPLVVQQERALMAGRKSSSTSTSSPSKQQQQPLIRQRSSIFRASSPPPLVHPAPSTRLPPSPSSSQKQKQKQKHRPVSFTITPAPAVELGSPASPTSPTSPASARSLSPPMSPTSPTSLSPPLSPSSPTFAGSGTYGAGYAYAYEYGAAAARRQSWTSVLTQGSGSGSRSSMESRGPVTPGPMTAGGGTQGFVVVVTGTDSDEDEEDDDNATRTSSSSLSAQAASQKSVQSTSLSMPTPMTKRLSRQSLSLGTHPTSPPPSIPLPLPPNSPRKLSQSGTTSSAVFPSSSYKSTNNMSNDKDRDSEIDLVQSHLSAIDASSDHVDLDSVLGISLYENGGGGIDTYPYSYAQSSQDSFITVPDDYTRVHDMHPTDTFVYGHAYAAAGVEDDVDEQEDEDEYFRSFASSPASSRRLSSSSPSVYATLRTRESFSAPSAASVIFNTATKASSVVQREREMKKIGVARQVILPPPTSNSAGCAASKGTLKDGQKEDANYEKERGQDNTQAHSGEWTLGLGSRGSIVPGVSDIGEAAPAAQKLVHLQSDTDSAFSSVYTISGSMTTTASITSNVSTRTTTTEGLEGMARMTNVPLPLGAAVQSQLQTRPRTNTVPHPYAPFSASKTHHLLSVPTASTASYPASSTTRERTQSDPSSISSTTNVNEDWTLDLGVPSKLKSQLKSLSSKSPLVKERNSDPILAVRPSVELIINVEDVDDYVRDVASDGKKVVESMGVPMETGAEVDFCVPRVVQNGRGMDDDAFLGVGGLPVRNKSRQALARIPVLKEEADEAEKVEEKMEDGRSSEDSEEEKDPRSRALMNAKANLATLDALSEDLRKFNEMLKAAANEGIVPKLTVRSKQSLDVVDRTHQKLTTKKSRSVLQIDEPPPPNAVLRGMPSVDALFVDVVGAGVELGADAFDIASDEKEAKSEETIKGPVSIPMAEFTRGPTRPRMTSRASSILSSASSNLSTKAPLPFSPFRSPESKPVKIECTAPVGGGGGLGRALSLREATALGPVSAFEHIHPRPSVSVSSGKKQLKITTTTSQLSQKLTSPSSSSLNSFASCESVASASSSTSSTPTVTPTRMAFANSLSLGSSPYSAAGSAFPPVVSPVYTHTSPVLHSARTRKTALSLSRKSPPLVLPKLTSPPPTSISTHAMSPISPHTPSAESLLSPLTPAASSFPMPPPLSVPLPPLPPLPSREVRQQRMLDPVSASLRVAPDEEDEGTSGEESMDSMEYYSARSSFSL